MKKALASTAAVLALMGASMVASAAPAEAGEFQCRSSYTARSFGGDVAVPAGATCTLTRGLVDGNIKVNTGGTLIVNATVVKGNIQAQEARRVDVRYASLTGSIQLDKGRQQIYLLSNRVNGDIQLMGNRVGPIQVIRNTVGGNLQCKSNSPAPTGYGNIVKGNKEDQCRRL